MSAEEIKVDEAEVFEELRSGPGNPALLADAYKQFLDRQKRFNRTKKELALIEYVFVETYRLGYENACLNLEEIVKAKTYTEVRTPGWARLLSWLSDKWFRMSGGKVTRRYKTEV